MSEAFPEPTDIYREAMDFAQKLTQTEQELLSVAVDQLMLKGWDGQMELSCFDESAAPRHRMRVTELVLLARRHPALGRDVSVFRLERGEPRFDRRQGDLVCDVAPMWLMPIERIPDAVPLPPGRDEYGHFPGCAARGCEATRCGRRRIVALCWNLHEAVRAHYAVTLGGWDREDYWRHFGPAVPYPNVMST